MPIHSINVDPQNVTGSVSLSEAADVNVSNFPATQNVLALSGSVAGLLVGGQPVSSANPIPISGSIGVSFVDQYSGGVSGSIPVSASLAGFRDPGGLLKYANVDNFGNQIITGSVGISGVVNVSVISSSHAGGLSGSLPVSASLAGFIGADGTLQAAHVDAFGNLIVTGSVGIAGVVNVTGSTSTIVTNVVTITGSVNIDGVSTVSGALQVTGSVISQQGTTPWIVSGSNWIPTVTGSIVVTNKVDTKITALSASVSFVSASAGASVILVSANPNRLGITLYNDTNKNVYVKLGVSASLNDYTTQLAKDDYYEIPFGYQGRIDSFSAVSVTGVVRITEIS